MKIGSLVECIKISIGRSSEFSVNMPKKGNIYTVRHIKKFNSSYSKCGILLEEIVNKPIKFATGSEEPYFPIEFFREVQPPIENIEEKIKEETLEIELV